MYGTARAVLHRVASAWPALVLGDVLHVPAHVEVEVAVAIEVGPGRAGPEPVVSGMGSPGQRADRSSLWNSRSAL